MVASRRHRQPLLHLTAAALAAATCLACSPESRPNLILISIDTLRADHLTPYGHGNDTSPALAEIARDGAVFTAAFAQAPWTIPSHASMLTGRYPCNHGALGNTAIRTDVPLLAEHLRAGHQWSSRVVPCTPRRASGRGRRGPSGSLTAGAPGSGQSDKTSVTPPHPPHQPRHHQAVAPRPRATSCPGSNCHRPSSSTSQQRTRATQSDSPRRLPTTRK